MDEKTARAIEEKIKTSTTNIDGHLVWNKSVKKVIEFDVNYIRRTAAKWYHLWKTDDDLKAQGLNVKYMPNMRCKKLCVSSHTCAIAFK